MGHLGVPKSGRSSAMSSSCASPVMPAPMVLAADHYGLVPLDMGEVAEYGSVWPGLRAPKDVDQSLLFGGKAKTNDPILSPLEEAGLGGLSLFW